MPLIVARTLIAAFATTLASAFCIGGASGVTIADPSDWSAGWAYSSVDIAGAGSASFAVEPAGGNPGARLASTTVTPTSADTAFSAALYQAVTVPAPMEGVLFSMRVDVQSGPGGFGQGQGVEVLVGQAGSLYRTGVGITGWPLNAFAPLTFDGTFTAATFTRVAGGGPSAPSFDGVTPTTFGFAVGNNMSATLVQYYDNWSLTYSAPAASAAPIPALSWLSLFGLAAAVGGLGLMGARRRA